MRYLRACVSLGLRVSHLIGIYKQKARLRVSLTAPDYTPLTAVAQNATASAFCEDALLPTQGIDADPAYFTLRTVHHPLALSNLTFLHTVVCPEQ